MQQLYWSMSAWQNLALKNGISERYLKLVLIFMNSQKVSALSLFVI